MKKKSKKKKNQLEKSNSQTQSQSEQSQTSQDFTTTIPENTQTQSQKKTTPSHIKNDINIKQVNAEITPGNLNKNNDDNSDDTEKGNINAIPEVGTAEIQTQPQAITPEAAGFVWELVFNKIADSKGEYWKLKKSEKETLSNLSVTVANKYLNEIFSQYPDIAGLIIALAIVVIPRFTQLKKEKKKNEPKPKQEAGKLDVATDKPFQAE